MSHNHNPAPSNGDKPKPSIPSSTDSENGTAPKGSVPMEPRPTSSDGTVVDADGRFPVNIVQANFTQNPETVAVVPQMFKPFGPVRKVRILTEHSLFDSGKVGEVPNAGVLSENRRCEDAVNFRCQDTSSLNRHCSVTPADDWHKEAYRKRPKQAEENLSDGTSDSIKAAGPVEMLPETVTFTQLNDDCLLEICDYLGLMDLLQLKKAYPRRMKMTIGNAFKRRKVIDLTDESELLTIRDTRNILTEVGNFVESVSIENQLQNPFKKPTAKALDLICTYCSSLKDLKIKGYQMMRHILTKFEAVFKSLEGLTLSECYLNESIEQSLKLATKLQRLDLSSNGKLTGKCLAPVKQLRYLNLFCCAGIQANLFLTFAANNTTLEYLNIAGCRLLNTEAIEFIAANMTELSHLECDNYYNLVDSASVALLATIPSLRRIKIHGSYDSELQETLAEMNRLEHLELSGATGPVDYDVLSKLTNLKVLRLTSLPDLGNEQLLQLCSGMSGLVELSLCGCDMMRVTHKSLIQCIRNNPRLKLLDLTECYYITKQLIYSAIDILKQATVDQKRNHRLKIFAFETSIDAAILNDDRVEASRHFLEISFDLRRNF